MEEDAGWNGGGGGEGATNGYDAASEGTENLSVSSSRPQTPANPMGVGVPLHVSAMTPHSHPESGGRNFFVGSC